MNIKDVNIGKKVVVIEGKYAGKSAVINDFDGCVWIKLEENGLEIEIHEEWLIEENTTIKFYSSKASSGASRKLFSYKGALAVFDRGGCIPVVSYKDGYIRANGDRRYH